MIDDVPAGTLLQPLTSPRAAEAGQSRPADAPPARPAGPGSQPRHRQLSP